MFLSKKSEKLKEILTARFGRIDILIRLQFRIFNDDHLKKWDWLKIMVIKNTDLLNMLWRK